MKGQEEKYLYDLSIVLPTLGRSNEVDAMLESIYRYDNSRYNIEIIVVDQNYSNLLDVIISKYSSKKYPLSHVKVPFRGLSKAKNFGAQKARGKYICFIDDDAEFLEGAIDLALSELSNNNIDIISGRCVDRCGVDSVVSFSDEESFLTLDDFEGKFVESTMFFKTNLTKKYSYDENMGVGAFYGSQEGYDIVYRMLRDGVIIKFNPSLKFYHPQTITDHTSCSSIKRSFNYRCGYGYLCRKHGFQIRFWSRFIKVLFYILVLPFFRPRDIRFYVAEELGNLVGWLI